MGCVCECVCVCREMAILTTSCVSGLSLDSHVAEEKR